MAIFPQGYQNIAARCRNTEDGGAERRVLRQLQRCLEDDYLVWHNVPVGNKGRLPDFVVLHPGRGLLVLEVKGWRAGALHHVSRHDVELNLANGQGRVSKIHPGLQARGYAIELVNQMQRDPCLCQTEGRHAGIQAQLLRLQLGDPVIVNAAVRGRAAEHLCGGAMPETRAELDNVCIQPPGIDSPNARPPRRFGRGVSSMVT